MKILLLSPLPPPAGGIASWTQRFLQTPQAKENEVYIVNTAVIGKRINQFNRINLIDEFKRMIHIISNLKKELKKNRPDIVHLNTSCSSRGLIRDCICGHIIKKSNSKLLIHCRCDVTYMVDNRLSELFLKKLVNQADGIITLNNVSREFIVDKYNKTSEIIPNFISESKLDSIDNLVKANSSIINIIYVGHITKMKGCDLIFKVAEHFPHIKFTMVGYISEEIAQITKPNNVIFTGEISKDQVIGEMGKADLFLFPTLTEGFPNALLEAMACGLPVVTTNVGAIPDMIEDKGGIVVNPGDIESVIKAIKSLEHDEKRREKMSLWNIQKVCNYYTEEKVMNNLFEMYKNLIL